MSGDAGRCVHVCVRERVCNCTYRTYTPGPKRSKLSVILDLYLRENHVVIDIPKIGPSFPKSSFFKSVATAALVASADVESAVLVAGVVPACTIMQGSNSHTHQILL